MTKSKTLAKKYGLREVCVDFGVYPFHFYVVVGPYKDVPKYVSYMHDEPLVQFAFEDAPNCRGRHFWKADYASVVWLPRVPKTPRDVSTLVHEMYHVISKLSIHIGLPMVQETEEAIAYALGYAVRTVLEGLSPRSR
jgi:hypothetical protein